METNEVEKIYSASLLSGYLEKEALIRDIKEKSQEVVRLRKNNAEAVSNYILELERFGTPMLEALDYINKEIDTYHKDDPNVDIIKEKCVAVSNCFNDFLGELTIVNKRFANKKIKITSVGAARSGKSEFTKLYTGLSEDIIKTKEGALDCTGSVCNLHHVDVKDGGFYAIVTFHKEKDILKKINALIESVRSDKSKSKDWNCQGKLPRKIMNMSEVKRLAEDLGFVKMLQEELVGVDISTSNGLMHFFKKTDYLTCVLPDNVDESSPEHQKRVETVKELETYNYIQASQPKYVAVKQIDLYTNLSNDGIFENFIVADTKGASSEAGPQANLEIIDSIEDSDAVFSVHYAAQTTGYGFYNVLLRQYTLEHSSFKNKHFVILNREDGLDETSRDNHLNNVLRTNTTKCMYVGQLVDTSNPKEPELFSKAVILDMLGRIAKYVRDFDQERINSCNNYIETLAELLQELDLDLNHLPLLLEYDKVNYIKGRISRFTQAIAAHITEKEQSLPDEVDYEIARMSGKLVTPYEIITGKPTKDENLMDDTEKAVEVFCREIEKIIDTPKDDLNIGHYLMNFIEEFLLRLGNRKHEASIQKKIDIKKETDELFDEVWKIARLTAKYNNINHPECQRESNKFIQGLIALYKEEWSENNDLTPHLFNYYPVLKSYFNNSDTTEESADLNKYPDIVDFNSLKTALQEAVSEMELRQYLENKYQDRGKALYNMYVNVREYFQKKLQKDACLQFYLTNEDILTIDDKEYDFKKHKCEADLEIQKRIHAIHLVKSEVETSLKPLVLPNKEDLDEKI